MKVAAGIVLYNPDIERLRRNVDAIIDQVEKIFIVNNGKKIAGADLKENYGFLKNKKVILINNEENFGIAKALNQIVEQCVSKKYEWVLLLDQDSVAGKRMIDKLTSEIKENISVVAPRIIDINKGKNSKNSKGIEDVDMVITSGSLIRVEDCTKLGMFDEKMFIDFVDFDYCKRVRLAGKRIVRVNNASMRHEVGKRTQKRFLGMRLYPTNHSKERVYYYGRNINYYKRKYKGKLSLHEQMYLFATKVWKVFTILCYEDNKMMKLKYYRKGARA